MHYLNYLEEQFDKNSQANLINRIKLRMGRMPIRSIWQFDRGHLKHVEVVAINNYIPSEINRHLPKHIRNYKSEADLNKRYPIDRDKLKFDDWYSLRDEIENIAVERANTSGLLEASLAKYLNPFKISSTELYEENGRQEDEVETGVLLREVSSKVAWEPNSERQYSYVCQLLEGMKQPKPPITKGLVNGLILDLLQLNRLIHNMSCLGEIIQGILFEINAPSSLTLKTLQHNSGVCLTDTLLAYRMAPLMGWTTEYCMRLMGNRTKICLDKEEILDSNPHPQPDNLIEERSEPIAVQINNEEIIDKEDPIDREKLHALGKKLNKEGFTQLKEDTDTWFFCYPRHKMQLYAYMMWKVTAASNRRQIPWKYLTKRIVPPKGVDPDDLRKEAHKLKHGIIKAPSGYACIDDAIKSVFGSSQRASNDEGSIKRDLPTMQRTKTK